MKVASGQAKIAGVYGLIVLAASIALGRAVSSKRVWLERAAYDLTGEKHYDLPPVIDLVFRSRLSHALELALSRPAEDFEIRRMFKAYLNREPDPGGFRFFQEVIGATGDREAVRVNYIGSDEYVDRFEIHEPRRWLLFTYERLFHLRPEQIDPRELEFRLRLLREGTVRADVAIAMIRSDERRCIWIGQTFFDLSGTMPSDSQLQSLTAMMTRGAHEEQVVAEILSAPEYVDAAPHERDILVPSPPPQPVLDFCRKFRLGRDG